MLGVVPLFTLDTGLSRYDALELSIILIDGKPGSDQAIALIIRHLTQNKTCFQCLDVHFHDAKISLIIFS